MERHKLIVKSNRLIAKNIWEMKLDGCTNVQKAGQFVNLELDGLFLRRPISVCDWEEDGTLTLSYRVVGKGTAQMSELLPGSEIDVLTALGNGFNSGKDCRKPLLIGGGIGVAPLYKLAKEIAARGLRQTVICGFKNASEIFYRQEFEAIQGLTLIITTEDGSEGVKGFVTDAMKGLEFDYFYTCGPMPMLKALCKVCDAPGEASLEERMGCGFGICMGCTCKTMTGGKRICKEGPVFNREELVW